MKSDILSLGGRLTSGAIQYGLPLKDNGHDGPEICKIEIMSRDRNTGDQI